MNHAIDLSLRSLSVGLTTATLCCTVSIQRVHDYKMLLLVWSLTLSRSITSRRYSARRPTGDAADQVLKNPLIIFNAFCGTGCSYFNVSVFQCLPSRIGPGCAQPTDATWLCCVSVVVFFKFLILLLVMSFVREGPKDAARKQSGRCMARLYQGYTKYQDSRNFLDLSFGPFSYMCFWAVAFDLRSTLLLRLS